jgi:uncharacterized membrane protein
MKRLRSLCGPFFVLAGAMHFIKPKAYEQIVPPYLPAPDKLVAASGVAEIAGGLGLMIPFTRRRAKWWLVATMLAVFPANIHMAEHPEQYPRIPGGERALRARLPLQALVIAWILAAGAPRRRKPPRGTKPPVTS